MLACKIRAQWITGLNKDSKSKILNLQNIYIKKKGCESDMLAIKDKQQEHFEDKFLTTECKNQ